MAADVATLVVRVEVEAATVSAAGLAMHYLVADIVLRSVEVHWRLGEGIAVEEDIATVVEADGRGDWRSFCDADCFFARIVACASPNPVDFVLCASFASPCCNRGTVFRRQRARALRG